MSPSSFDAVSRGEACCEMSMPKPHPSSDVGILEQSLKEHSARILGECTAAFADAGKRQADQSQLETIQKNLPLLLDEMISLLPQVMRGEADVPPVPTGGMECRMEHRLDVVIKALSGVSEIVELELLRLKGFVADAFLTEACRETRLFFDLKAANYCLQFVGAQEEEVALRASQLKDANERLMAASKNSAAAHSRLQLLRGVTHELRNSLQSVLLYATSLVEGPRDPGVTDVIERLATSGIHLQKLLDRIQNYSPLLAGESHASHDTVDLSKFLDELELRHRALARTTRTQLVCKQAGGPARITTDLSKLNSIADTLVSNAIRSAKTGIVEVEISQEGPERILLTVTDNGNGIGLEEARQIFRVLHHVGGSHFSGLKLGLLASRYLTHLLGGEITFESEAGEGASFRVALPILPADQQR